MWHFCVHDLVNSLALTAPSISVVSTHTHTHAHTHFKHTNMNLPTGDLSNHIDVVFTPKSTEVGDDCRCYDLLRQREHWFSMWGKVHTTPLSGRCKTRSSVPQSRMITVVQMPPAGPLNEHNCCISEKKERKIAKQRTYHYEFYRDGQRQLLFVALIDFFGHNKNKKCQQADHQLWQFSFRQQTTNIQKYL